MTRYKIAEARIAKGWTQADLARHIDTTQQQVARYESGENDVKSSVLIKMSKALGVTISYLLGMTGEDDQSESDFEDVPLYGSIAAGRPIEMVKVGEWHAIPGAVRRRYPDGFLLKVVGESMNRVLPNGCYALVDPCDEIDHDMQPYAICINGYDATIKRVRKLANGFELVPDSTDLTYRPTVYDYGIEGTETVTIIGRVVWYCIPYEWDF